MPRLRLPSKTFHAFRACSKCHKEIPEGQRRRCSACESVSYCCQRDHWSQHKPACAEQISYWRGVPEEERPLVSAARKFLNRHVENLVFLAGQYFQKKLAEEQHILGRSVLNMSDEEYCTAWEKFSRQWGFMVEINEKNGSTLEHPSSADVYYVPNSGHLVPLPSVPGDHDHRLSLITQKESAATFIGAIVVVAGINHKDNTPCRVIITTLAMGDVNELRVWAIANKAEAALAAQLPPWTRQASHESAAQELAYILVGCLMARVQPYVRAPSDRID
ncbi:hypothetical protein MPER_13101 [Moniliophthora perniciosa FA553]|nr:hypothetical protein MPER_13101 [Moniliophthora perniciosa FA553]